MKNYWIAVIVAGMLTAVGTAQTGASGSASANTSASTGKTGASANASGSAQASEGSANRGKQQGNASSSANTGVSGNAAANSSGAALSSGTTLQAELTKSLDAKKAKPGDEVSAKTTQDVKSNGKVVIHKGSKLVGHVTQAQARTKEDSESKLGIVFDHAVLKDGSQVSVNAVVQALAAAQTAPLSAGVDDIGRAGGGASGGGRQPTGGGGGVVGGVAGAATSTVGSTAGGVGSAAGSVASSTTGSVGSTVNGAAGVAANGTLNSASRGVVGLQGLTLTTVGAGSAQGPVISSTTQNVKLDSGTQMVLQVAGAAQQ